MALRTLPGKELPAAGTDPKREYYAQRDVRSLQGLGVVDEAEAEVLRRLTALGRPETEERYDAAAIDVFAAAHVASDPNRLRGFTDDEKKLPPQLWKKLEADPVTEAPEPPSLFAKRESIVDVTDVLRGRAYDADAQTPMSDFPEQWHKALARLERVHDSDGAPDTVCRADLAKGMAPSKTYTDRERAIFGEAKAWVEARAVASQTGRPSIVVPIPGVRAVELPSTVAGVTFRALVTTSIEKRERLEGRDTSVELKLQNHGAYELELPPGTSAVLIQEEPPQQEFLHLQSGPLVSPRSARAIRRGSPAEPIPAGTYRVELWRTEGTRERIASGQVKLPSVAKVDLDLDEFATHELVTPNFVALEAVMTSCGHQQYRDDIGERITHFQYPGSDFVHADESNIDPDWIARFAARK